MRVHVALVVLAFAAARAHAEPLTVDEGTAVPSGGARYLSIGLESISMSTVSPAPAFATAATIDAGIRLGATPFYAHAGAAAARAGHVDARGGLELRVGGMVKGLFGVDLGYQRDPRGVDAMYSVAGPFVAPRVGLELGTEALWIRGLLDWRYTLASGPNGHATSLGLLVGRDF